MKIKKITKKSGKVCGKNLGSLRQKAIWKPKICGGIFGQIHPKIAISNGRIRGIDDKTVTFDYKDYRQKASKSRWF